MKTRFGLWLGLVAICFALSSPGAAGEGPKSDAPTAPNRISGLKPQPKYTRNDSQRPIPFRGTIKEMDAAAGTFTIGERKFKLAAQAKVLKSQKPMALKDAHVGDWVTGSYKKNDKGELLVATLYIGGKLPVTAPASTNALSTATNTAPRPAPAKN